MFSRDPGTNVPDLSCEARIRELTGAAVSGQGRACAVCTQAAVPLALAQARPFYAASQAAPMGPPEPTEQPRSNSAVKLGGGSSHHLLHGLSTLFSMSNLASDGLLSDALSFPEGSRACGCFSSRRWVMTPKSEATLTSPELSSTPRDRHLWGRWLALPAAGRISQGKAPQTTSAGVSTGKLSFWGRFQEREPCRP